jgi:hypothetical protein
MDWLTLEPSPRLRIDVDFQTNVARKWRVFGRSDRTPADCCEIRLGLALRCLVRSVPRAPLPHPVTGEVVAFLPLAGFPALQRLAL